ncbi:UvrABC system protein C [Desulfosarcina widdelii]|uniref:UvrABC system protein C n=1 Tax=Desulfosarcina widdelii TaxID=947919 RepID=A0A5K7Z239_9BACT|nr:excinuclease ABC subunit UvrC [Desulfosarcina widdelii]BBO73581.1 UvrABC system protein C [Desulfosarcina widdelii]
MKASAKSTDSKLLQDIIDGISYKPGVYMMKDAEGTILYVGKAVNLKKRVTSYFQNKKTHSPKTALMVARVADIDTVVTASEKEALILESNLIKRHRPRFNVVLKDDKRYPSIRIDARTVYPKIEIVRKTPKDGAVYFGPFSSALAVRQTVKLINKTFPLRKCSDRSMANRTRPCIHHQMGQCLGPCCLTVDPKKYSGIVKEVILFLKGRTPELIQRIRRRMIKAASDEDFEAAAALRDRMFALEKTLERQVTVTTDFMDRDVIGISGNSDFRLVTVMTLRRGFLQGVRHFELVQAAPEKGELVAQFLGQFYQESHVIPVEVLVPDLPAGKILLEETLSEWKGRRVRIHRPTRGEKRKLLEMAQNNADNTLRDRLQRASREAEVLEGLQRRLHMDRLPLRIECFDNSNLGGTNPVSAMVVFENGRPYKAGYRRYKIRSASGQDDYASMAEVLTRRYGKIGPDNPAPDLMLVDGGRGQLAIANAVIGQLGLDGQFHLAGIAKKDERKGEVDDKIYLPDRANPVNLGHDGRFLLLLQQIRDEAHRFAITFQRKRRNRSMVRSALDQVAGVGPKRKAMLLKHFGSIKKIRAATVDEISELPGINRSLAEAIRKVL